MTETKIALCGNVQMWCECCECSMTDMGAMCEHCEECGEPLSFATREQLIAEGNDPADITEVPHGQ